MATAATPFPDVPAHGLDELRRAEAIIVWLRWLAMASWPFILIAAPHTVAPAAVWAVYALGLAYTAATHVLNRTGRAIRATAFATTVADPGLTAIACAVTGGLASPIYPFFYLTTLATSIRLGMGETLATVGLTAALSTALFAWAPGSRAGAGDLALAVFYLFFVALEGGLLSRAARAESRRRQETLWRLIHAEEEERRRVAGEIHDRLGSRFFTAHHTLERMRAAAAHDPEAERALAPLADAIRACADELRAITNALRPVVLDDFGFVEALREHVAGLAGSEGAPRVTLAVDAPDPRPPAVRVMLFRVLQEALLNALKHAGATEVRVAFAAAPDALVLTVRDDGRGFDPASVPRGHLGLVYMRERAEACGSRLDVRSRAGSGTEIRVSVPLERT
ncbi:MAG TPA: sensor histidine kinase [Candidatus Binatia bacterium]